MSYCQRHLKSPGRSEQPARLQGIETRFVEVQKKTHVHSLLPGSAQEMAVEYNFQWCARPYRQKNPTPWHNTKYKLLTDGKLDLNNLLSCQKPHSSETLAVLAWCKPAELMHGSSEVTEAAETPVLRQSFPALLASVQTQNAKRDKLQDKPKKNPI